jgi:hypothetical protein
MKVWNPQNKPATTANRNPAPADGAANQKPEPLFELPKELPDYWYQSAKNTWWIKNDQGIYCPYQTSHARDLLLEAGYRGASIPGERLSPVSRILLLLRKQNVIVWAGQLAGYKQGVMEMCQCRILITQSPIRIKAKKGAWPTLEKFLTELFGKDVVWFYAWLKSSLRSMLAGRPFRPGQCLAFAGKPGGGKSFLQSLITDILGGRASKPFEWLMGESNFNKDVFSSEHLMLEDEASSLDPRKRSQFGQKLKNLVANTMKKCHPKGVDALYLEPFWRTTISLNDTPESLLVLPPITGDFADKLIFLRAGQATFPYGDDDLKGRTEYHEKLKSELPGFLDFLFTWKIPKALASKRYGVREYQNAELMSLLNELQPEFRLLDLIDHLQIWDVDGNPFVGTSSQLQDALEEKDQRGRVAKILAWHSACGQYLAKLAMHVPERVKALDRVHNQAIWEVKPKPAPIL